MNDKKLKLSHDRVLAGVCGGIAEFIEWPANKVRWLWTFLTFFSGGSLFIAYIICAVSFPRPPKKFDLNDFRQQ